MIKTVKKWFWAWNDDKEEIFLEDMAAMGFELISVGLGRYKFEEGKPKKIKYQLDFKGLTKMSEQEYLQIYEDAGWKNAHRLGSWYYFSKEYEEGDSPDISIFSDNKSRLEKYRRLIFFMLIIGFPLYYNVIILFPGLDQTEFIFPKFYFFFRIIAIILIILHAGAMVKLVMKIIKERKNIRE